MNGIVTCIGRLNQYADDCILFRSGNNWDRMVNPIQSDLHSVHKWCVGNKLKLNTAKSKTLLSGSAKLISLKMLTMTEHFAYQILTYPLSKTTNTWVSYWTKICHYLV